jgi:hypothetical protein
VLSGKVKEIKKAQNPTEKHQGLIHIGQRRIGKAHKIGLPPPQKHP